MQSAGPGPCPPGTDRSVPALLREWGDSPTEKPVSVCEGPGLLRKLVVWIVLGFSYKLFSKSFYIF